MMTMMVIIKKLNLEGCRVVGVDPGRKDLFVAVDQEITKCSTKEYYEIARFRKTREKREVWMNNNKYIQAIVRGKRCNPKIDRSINQSINQYYCFISGLPTPSVPSVCGFQVQYLSEVLFYMDDLFNFYKEKRWRRSRWSNYIGKQEAMDKLCKRITNNEDKTVVAFG